MGHMINRQSHAFSCNSGNNCTRNRLNCTRLRLVQLAVARAELHSKACDYLYKLVAKNEWPTVCISTMGKGLGDEWVSTANLYLMLTWNSPRTIAPPAMAPRLWLNPSIKVSTHPYGNHNYYWGTFMSIIITYCWIDVVCFIVPGTFTSFCVHTLQAA